MSLLALKNLKGSNPSKGYPSPCLIPFPSLSRFLILNLPAVSLSNPKSHPIRRLAEGVERLLRLLRLLPRWAGALAGAGALERLKIRGR